DSPGTEENANAAEQTAFRYVVGGQHRGIKSYVELPSIQITDARNVHVNSKWLPEGERRRRRVERDGARKSKRTAHNQKAGESTESLHMSSYWHRVPAGNLCETNARSRISTTPSKFTSALVSKPAWTAFLPEAC